MTSLIKLKNNECNQEKSYRSGIVKHCQRKLIKLFMLRLVT